MMQVAEPDLQSALGFPDRGQLHRFHFRIHHDFDSLKTA
jgi:hypothetical protein